jgi:hypothetical protein
MLKAPSKAVRASFVQLGALINKDPGAPEIKDNPTLKTIFAELSRRNQTLLDVSEAISERCRAAQGRRHTAI